MRKILVLLVTLCLAFSMSAVAELEKGVVITATPDMYSDVIDLSVPETVSIYLVGDTPNDLDMVIGKINERLQADFNTTIELTIMSWSDYTTMYPLVLTGGDEIDLIFTCTWCFLWTEGQKGSFKVLTDEFIQTYMPLSWQYQEPLSWGTTKLNGEMIAIPQNYSAPHPSLIGVRTDIMEQVGVTEISSFAEYKDFLLKAAALTADNGVYAYDAGNTDTGMATLYYMQYDQMHTVDGYFRYAFDPANPGYIPTADDFTFLYYDPCFTDFIVEAKEMADAGVWSRNAMNNTTIAAQSFANGTSASITWNYTVFQYMQLAGDNGFPTYAYMLEDDQAFTDVSEYNKSAMAITASSKKPERAAMVLDILKFDHELQATVTYGIEGYHWTDNGDFTFSEAEHTQDYAVECISLSWVCRNGQWSEVYGNENERYIREETAARKGFNTTTAFVFDSAPVNAYYAAINAVIEEYRLTLLLGLVDDVEVTYGAFTDALTEAGYEAFEAEYFKQYQAWYDLQ